MHTQKTFYNYWALKSSFYISKDFFKQKRHDRNIRDWQNKKSITIDSWIFDE